MTVWSERKNHLKIKMSVNFNFFYRGKHYVVTSGVGKNKKIRYMTVYLVTQGSNIATMKYLDISNALSDKLCKKITEEVYRMAEKIDADKNKFKFIDFKNRIKILRSN